MTSTSDPHAGGPVLTAGAPVAGASAVIIAIHGRGAARSGIQLFHEHPELARAARFTGLAQTGLDGGEQLGRALEALGGSLGQRALHQAFERVGSIG